MGWLGDLLGRSAGGPKEMAERLTNKGRMRLEQDTAALGDVDLVRTWLRDLRPGQDQQILVHRGWGTVAAVADKSDSIEVVRSDSAGPYYAVAPGAPDKAALTSDQVERIVIDALTSPGPPSWPEWREL